MLPLRFLASLLVVCASLASSLFAAPTVSVTSPAPGVTVSSLTTVSITFSESVAGVDADDLLINNESAATVTGSGAGPYVFTFTQPPPGLVSVSWDFDHGIAGLGTGAFAPASGWTYTLTDTVAPTIAKIRTTVAGQEMDAVEPANGATLTDLTQARVTFSEIVTGVDASDLLLKGVPATSVTGSGAGPYVFTFAQPSTGAAAFTWAASPGIVDSAANAFVTPGPTWSVTVATSPGVVVINEFLAANASGLTDENGDTSDWIELYNSGATAVNLVGWSLSDDADHLDMWVFPSRTIAAGGYLVVYASGKDRKPASGNLHTNFTLPADGGKIFLYPPNSPRLAGASVFNPYPGQRYNYSYGPQTGGALRYFATPTPGAANGTSALTAITAKPNVNVSRGFFKEPFSLMLTCADATATIRYTLDGSDPLVTSTAYTAPLTVSNTTILRMASFGPSSVPSETVTHTYMYLDSVLTQPSPPYDNPANANDNTNPALPTVSNVPAGSGGVQFPVAWGSRTLTGTAAFPGLLTNLSTDQIPADYGMDPEVVNDATKYNDAGVVDSVNGKLNIDRIKQGLRDLPILSVVMKQDDMFGASTGMYVYPRVTQKTPLIEKPCSLELLLPDGTTAFATTCGIRIHGNSSRNPENNPKHGFKLNFKGSYGASELAYALFPDSPVQEFDDLILRGDFNSSWLHWDNSTQRPKGTRLRDAFSKDTFRAMGRAAGHNRYVNLFINGVYWGTYDPAEQENNGFAAAYFGGKKDDYDIYDQGALKAGTSTAYTAMTSIASPIDNTKYEQMKTYLDVPWFIDYMILHFFLGHQDWGDDINKNWYAARNNKIAGSTFKYLPWDMENLLWDQTVDRTGVASPASGLHPKLITNPQYCLDFADRVHKHMVAADGALLPAANIARWNKWQAIIANAIVCESARWGDYRRDVHPHNAVAPLYTWNGTFMTEVNRLKNTYFPNRIAGQSVLTQGVLPQLRTRGLYPMLNAPEFRNNTTNLVVSSQRVTPGFQLKMQFPLTTSYNTGGTATTNAGTFYYTTDGTDPRVYYDTTGARTPSAVAYTGPITINSTTTIKARTLSGVTWSALMEATFLTTTPQPSIRITELHYNPPTAQGGSSAEFIEIQNTGTTNVDMGNWYFNGVDFIFPINTTLGPGDRMVLANNNAPATFAAQFPGVSVFGYFGGSLDNSGERIALNDATGRCVVSVNYDDVSPWPLTPDGSGPSLEIIDPNGDSNSPFNWKASAAPKGTPGAANSAYTPSTVIISEFLTKNTGAYTCSAATPGFIELANTGASAVDIGNWTLSATNASGLPAPFSFPVGTSIPAGGYVLVHYNSTSLPGLSVTDTLNSQQGIIALFTNTGVVADGVRFGPQVANYSFSRIAGAWALSTPTAGASNSSAAAGTLSTVRLNEWVANPLSASEDWLELVNTNATLPVVLTNALISTGGELFRVPVPAAIGAGAYLQLYCIRGSDRGDALDFQLPAAGTTLTLMDASGNSVDTLTFTTQVEGVSQGRLPNATGSVTTLPYPSPGVANYAALTGQPVINEILVTNLNGENAPWARRSPWLELRNPGVSAVSLAGWQLRHPANTALSWTIPAGVSIPAGGYLPIWADSAQAASTVNGLHLNYAFTPNTTVPLVDGVELVNPSGQIVDRITWGKQITDLSIGRTNTNTWALLATSTRGSLNSAEATLGAASSLRINEWFATGSGIDFDYIELYNTGALPVSLGGLYLSDEPSEVGRRKYQIPALSFIAGNGFVTFNADGSRNAFYTGYSLTDTGEYLRLALGDDTVVDSLGFGLQLIGTSQGRVPEGSTTTATFAKTPGIANQQGTGPWFTSLPPSRVVPAGSSTTFTVAATGVSSIQWRFNGSPIGGATAASYTIASVTGAHDGVYDCVVTGPGGNATSAPATLTVLHTFASWAAEKGLLGADALPGADPDGDGYVNLAEFLANTDPTIGASLPERLNAHVFGTTEFSGATPTFLTLDFRLNRRAALDQLMPEKVASLPGTWLDAAPDVQSLISTESNGDQHWRWKVAIPVNSPKYFLRLRIVE